MAEVSRWVVAVVCNISGGSQSCPSLPWLSTLRMTMSSHFFSEVIAFRWAVVMFCVSAGVLRKRLQTLALIASSGNFVERGC